MEHPFTIHKAAALRRAQQNSGLAATAGLFIVATGAQQRERKPSAVGPDQDGADGLGWVGGLSRRLSSRRIFKKRRWSLSVSFLSCCWSALVVCGYCSQRAAMARLCRCVLLSVCLRSSAE